MSTAPKFTAKEWDAGGSIYSYGTLPTRSFIIKVFTTGKVDGETLQKAVNKTLERLPYYSQTLVRKKGLYYYADNDLPMLVTESKDARPLGGELTNYHMADVTYFDNSISFSMCHSLWDGLGMNRFVESVLYYYFCFKDGKEYSDNGIITSKIPYDPEEALDIFDREYDVDKNEMKKLRSSEVRFKVPEINREEKRELMYRYPLRIKTEALLSWAKSVQSSPAPALAAIMGKAVVKENKVEEGNIVACVPYSLRKALHAEKTYKNCASAVMLSMTPDECENMPAGELAAKLRVQMKQQMTDEFGVLKAASLRQLFIIGKSLPGYALKKKIFSVPEKHPQDTFGIDYVGSLHTNDYSDQITEVQYLNPDAFGGSLFVLMSETAGYFHINFNQSFEDKKYYDRFAEVLDELSIPYDKLTGDTYLNPEIIFPGEQK